jgi:hypothetical protein
VGKTKIASYDLKKQRMKDLEDEFRLRIERNQVQIKDGKLAMQEQLNGGINNVRV